MNQEHCRAEGICPVREGVICRAVQHPRYCQLARQDREALASDPSHVPYWLNFLIDQPAPEVPTPSFMGRADREAYETVAQLTEMQKAEVLHCPSRRQVPANCCAGFVDVCGVGYWDGGAITTIHCAKCRLAGWTRQ